MGKKDTENELWLDDQTEDDELPSAEEESMDPSESAFSDVFDQKDGLQKLENLPEVGLFKQIIEQQKEAVPGQQPVKFEGAAKPSISLEPSQFEKLGQEIADFLKEQKVSRLSIVGRENGVDTLVAEFLGRQIDMDPATGCRKVSIAPKLLADVKRNQDGSLELSNIKGLTAEVDAGTDPLLGIKLGWVTATVDKAIFRQKEDGDYQVEVTGSWGTFSKNTTIGLPKEQGQKLISIINDVDKLRADQNLSLKVPEGDLLKEAPKPADWGDIALKTAAALAALYGAKKAFDFVSPFFKGNESSSQPAPRQEVRRPGDRLWYPETRRILSPTDLEALAQAFPDLADKEVLQDYHRRLSPVVDGWTDLSSDLDATRRNRVPIENAYQRYQDEIINRTEQFTKKAQDRIQAEFPGITISQRQEKLKELIAEETEKARTTPGDPLAEKFNTWDKAAKENAALETRLNEQIEQRRQLLEKQLEAFCRDHNKPVQKLQVVEHMPSAGAYVRGEATIRVSKDKLADATHFREALVTILHELGHAEQDKVIVRDLIDEARKDSLKDKALKDKVQSLYEERTGRPLNGEFYNDVLAIHDKQGPLTAAESQRAKTLAETFKNTKTIGNEFNQLAEHGRVTDLHLMRLEHNSAGSVDRLFKALTQKGNETLRNHLFENGTIPEPIQRLVDKWQANRDANGRQPAALSDAARPQLMKHLEGRIDQINQERMTKFGEYFDFAEWETYALENKYRDAHMPSTVTPRAVPGGSEVERPTDVRQALGDDHRNNYDTRLQGALRPIIEHLRDATPRILQQMKAEPGQLNVYKELTAQLSALQKNRIATDWEIYPTAPKSPGDKAGCDYMLVNTKTGQFHMLDATTDPTKLQGGRNVPKIREGGVILYDNNWFDRMGALKTDDERVGERCEQFREGLSRQLEKLTGERSLLSLGVDGCPFPDVATEVTDLQKVEHQLEAFRKWAREEATAQGNQSRENAQLLNGLADKIDRAVTHTTKTLAEQPSKPFAEAHRNIVKQEIFNHLARLITKKPPGAPGQPVSEVSVHQDSLKLKSADGTIIYNGGDTKEVLRVGRTEMLNPTAVEKMLAGRKDIVDLAKNVLSANELRRLNLDAPGAKKSAFDALSQPDQKTVLSKIARKIGELAIDERSSIETAGKGLGEAIMARLAATPTETLLGITPPRPLEAPKTIPMPKPLEPRVLAASPAMKPPNTQSFTQKFPTGSLELAGLVDATQSQGTSANEGVKLALEMIIDEEKRAKKWPADQRDGFAKLCDAYGDPKHPNHADAVKQIHDALNKKESTSSGGAGGTTAQPASAERQRIAERPPVPRPQLETPPDYGTLRGTETVTNTDGTKRERDTTAGVPTEYKERLNAEEEQVFRDRHKALTEKKERTAQEDVELKELERMVPNMKDTAVQREMARHLEATGQRPKGGFKAGQMFSTVGGVMIVSIAVLALSETKEDDRPGPLRRAGRK